MLTAEIYYFKCADEFLNELDIPYETYYLDNNKKEIRIDINELTKHQLNSLKETFFIDKDKTFNMDFIIFFE